MEHTLEALQRTATFAGISRDALGFLLEKSRMLTVPAGHVFFTEHDHGDTFYLIEEGRVGIHKTKGGVRREVGELGAGECFGEMALLSVSDRSGTVTALEPCVCLELSNRSLLELYRVDAGQFAMIMMNLGREVCRRLRDLNDRLLSDLVVARGAGLELEGDCTGAGLGAKDTG
ncbi:MAG: cyclic nucleotide-binding domain-containing protein [Myxococcales bacterium]|nr:cyclic nucleotide-binding domain-containing protein [Myxococcales bacterium]MCB9736141.1 cyclic nucleotide-binding domain-containing protein [Deltaproteobacteria bacterium]